MQYLATSHLVPSCWPPTVRHKILTDVMQKRDLLKDYSQDFLATWIEPFFPPEEKTPSSFEAPVLGPPTGHCLQCSTNLTTHNKPVQVKYATVTGKILEKHKVTLRCSTCRVNYGFDKYGSRSAGYRFYSEERDAIVANDTLIVDRALFNIQWSFGQHSWVSFQGFAESWHDAHSIQKVDEVDRRVWADSFWWGEIEKELRELGWIDYRFHTDQDREDCMRAIDIERRKAPYSHSEAECNADCKARGCGLLWVTDGIWKTQFAHCMFSVKNQVDGIPVANLPECCTNEPLPGKAFCSVHCRFCETRKPSVPTGLRDFLKHVGREDDADMVPVDEEATDKHLVVSIDHQYATPVIEDLGGQDFIQNNGAAVSDIVQQAKAPPSRCSKDLGERDTLRKMSRGHQFVVRAGGHIDMWTPLYQSESPTQVFIFLLSWLYNIVSTRSPDTWDQMWLAYDNMCQLEKMKITNQDLPLPSPYNKMWKKVNKIIDSLHISNHIETFCQTKLHPGNFDKAHPELKATRNTQAGEQTFVWLARFKKIVCSMPKTHHLFYIHRMVKRRNTYTAKCYRNGRKPVLPGIRNAKST